MEYEYIWVEGNQLILKRRYSKLEKEFQSACELFDDKIDPTTHRVRQGMDIGDVASVIDCYIGLRAENVI